MSLLKKFIDLLIYGNFWIGLCAVSLTLVSQKAVLGEFEVNYLLGFVFSATIVLYAAHRVIGIQKVKNFTHQSRFDVINKYRSHILIYGILAATACVFFFFFMTTREKIASIAPVAFSFLYVTPLLPGKNRLRDISYLKIFLIAIVWAWVTVVLPVIEYIEWKQELWIMILERTLFIFAITLPFDIRDLKVDKVSGLSTIPGLVGINTTKLIIAFSLLCAAVLSMVGYTIGIYSWPIFQGVLLTYALTYIICHFSDSIQHDYYYSGLLDGTMILMLGLILLFYAL